MASTYYVRPSGSNTPESPYDSWAKAANSFWTIADLGTLVTGDIIYVGSDFVEPDVAAAKTLAGPGTLGQIASVISVTTGTTTYASGAQIKSTGGAYDITLSGGLLVSGCVFESGRDVLFDATYDKTQRYKNCTFKVANNENFGHLTTSYDAALRFDDCTFSFANDTAARSTICWSARAKIEIHGGSFAMNATYPRTGSLFTGVSQCSVLLSGVDLSELGSSCEITAGAADYGNITMYGCKMPADFDVSKLTASAYTRHSRIESYNCSSTDAPERVLVEDPYGYLTSTTANVRSGGASVEGVDVAWEIVTTAKATRASPFYTPWVYGTAATAGSKTVSLALTSELELTDAQAWIEVEAMATDSSGQLTLTTDEAGPSAAGQAQATDSSTWTSASTYKQLLSASVTVGETGVFRARAAFATEITDANNLFLDPKAIVA